MRHATEGVVMVEVVDTTTDAASTTVYITSLSETGEVRRADSDPRPA